MTAQPDILLTVSEYFRHDQRSHDKLEYFHGTIVAQAGATARHNAIVTNVIGHLFPQLRRQDCHIYPSDLRIQAIDQHVYTYPDLTIVCGPPHFLEPSELTLINRFMTPFGEVGMRYGSGMPSRENARPDSRH